MRLTFVLGPALVCALAAWCRADAASGAVVRDGAAGLAAGLLLAGGLALAERFFAGRAARMLGGVTFAALLAVGGAGVGFAGCIPYPYLRTVRPANVQRAPLHGHPNGSPTPAPTPHKVLDWGLWPFPNANDY